MKNKFDKFFSVESKTDDSILIVDKPFKCDGEKTPFGRRWGGETIKINQEQLKALQEGKQLAIDVQNEYVVFLKSCDDE